MNLYRYKYVESDGKTVFLPNPYNTPYVWSIDVPSSDYVLATPEEIEAQLIKKVESNYPERRNQGKAYSDFMNARLIVLRDMLPEALKDPVCGAIYDLTNKARLEITEGLWISAKREMGKVSINPSLEGMISTYSLPINQANLIQEIKDRIDKAIEELY